MSASRQETMSRIQNAVLDGRYILTPHAWMEMQADNLVLSDVETALLRGRIDSEYRDDPRGTRYRVVGTACDLTTPVGVILRFVLEAEVLIITTFVIETDE